MSQTLDQLSESTPTGGLTFAGLSLGFDIRAHETSEGNVGDRYRVCVVVSYTSSPVRARKQRSTASPEYIERDDVAWADVPRVLQDLRIEVDRALSDIAAKRMQQRARKSKATP